MRCRPHNPAQIGLQPAGGVEAERRAAGQRNGIDAVRRTRGIEQVGLADAGPAAADIDGNDGGRVEHHRRHAGGEPGIIGMADPDAGDVGQ